MKGMITSNLSVKQIRFVVNKWMEKNLNGESKLIEQGLPEYDDRYDLWRVSLVMKQMNHEAIAEIKIDGKLTVVDNTKIHLIKSRIKKLKNDVLHQEKKRNTQKFFPFPMKNKVIFGDSLEVLDRLPKDTAQLIITSPPYYNAKPQYSEYLDYQDYLEFLRMIFAKAHRILSDGRFCIVNISPILIRRTSRSTASKRIPIPFDVHKIMESVGFEFVDDIIWVKPEGAGWNIGRGRRFAADRQPLQYKPVPVTEYVLVYRKQSDKLIDWNLRQHHDRTLIKESLVIGEYDVTNIWRIHPAFNKVHPAVFPYELIKRLVRYYSFKDDLVLDPFAGSGVVGKVAHDMGRRFLLIDNEKKYFELMKEELKYVKDDVKFEK